MKDQLETQLKLLKMQYHPHFLFNALNTIYFLIDEENEEAIEAVELLSDLLRYQLYDINTKVTIEEEIDYLRTYIQFQRLRMTKRLQFEESFDPELTGQKSILETLPAQIFMQVHRSFIVNLSYVQAIEGNLLIIGEHKIPVSRPYGKRYINRSSIINSFKDKYPKTNTLFIIEHFKYSYLSDYQ